MDDDIYLLKSDIQRCIANGDTHFKSNYRMLFFEKDDKEYIQTLGALDNLYITPAKSSMEITGAINKDLLAALSLKEIEKIKQNVFVTDAINMIHQMHESNKTEEQKEMELENYLDELEESEQEYREAKENEINQMKFIQQLLFEKCGLGLIYEKHKEMLTLSGNFTNIILDKEALNYLEVCATKVDTFLIASIYDDSDNCTGVRLVLSIDLDKEE
jgi:hypothetical protein